MNLTHTRITTMNIAKEILKQLGGNKFIAMTGAKNLVAHADGLSFRVGRNAKAVNYCKITLNTMDEYDCEFGAIRGTTYKVKSSCKAFCDTLQGAFESNTGLYTKLF